VLPKDEINCTQDVAVSVKLVAGLGQESILVSVKANTIVSLLGVISRKSNGLGATSIGVLDVDIVSSSSEAPLARLELCWILTTLLVYEAVSVV
jgi:hypothetical protein